MIVSISLQSALALMFAGFFFGFGFAAGSWLFGLLISAIRGAGRKE